MKINSQLDWVASYPKSGNTWIRLLLASYRSAQLMHYTDTSVYMFQCVSPHPLNELDLVQQVQLRNAALLHIAVVAPAEVPTVIKTHHANCEVLGIPLFPEACVRRAIYIMRDPRDVACSFAHHFNISHEKTVEVMGTRTGIFQPERTMTYIMGSWSEHVISWIDRQSDFPTHITQYEKLHEDALGELRKIVKFLGWKLDEDRLRQAVEENQFKLLQKAEEQDGFSEQASSGKAFFRRGQVGAWKDELDPELARQIERDHGEVMRRMGYAVERKLRVAK